MCIASNIKTRAPLNKVQESRSSYCNLQSSWKRKKRKLKKTSFPTYISKHIQEKRNKNKLQTSRKATISTFDLGCVDKYHSEIGSAGTLGNFTSDFSLLWCFFTSKIWRTYKKCFLSWYCCSTSWIEIKVVKIKFERNKWSFKVSSIMFWSIHCFHDTGCNHSCNSDMERGRLPSPFAAL